MGFRYMCLDKGQLTFDYGKGVYCCRATTGRLGAMDPSIEDVGPIPPGDYLINPHDASNTHVEGIEYIARRTKGDWGHYRVKLYPHQVKNIYNRSEFFLHGGSLPGSAGCIDIGAAEEDIFKLIEQTNENNGTDNILVRVTNTPNDIAWEYRDVNKWSYTITD